MAERSIGKCEHCGAKFPPNTPPCQQRPDLDAVKQWVTTRTSKGQKFGPFPADCLRAAPNG